MRFRALLTMMTVALLGGCATRADTDKVYSEYQGNMLQPSLFSGLTVTFDPNYRQLNDANVADVVPALGRLGVQDVDLNGADLTDAAMSSLGQLWELRRLRVVGTAVTPAGVMQLRNLGKLRQLDVGNDHFTPQAVRRLKSDFPNTEFHMYFKNPKTNYWEPVEGWK